MTPEGLVKQAIKAEMKYRNWYFHMPVGVGYGAATLDFLCCMPITIQPKDVGQRVGVFLGVETKRADGPGIASPRQSLVIEQIGRAGGIGIVARSWDDVANVVGMRL